MKRSIIKGDSSVESLFPNAVARAAADKFVDEMPEETTTIAQALEAWESEYFKIAGKSPFRGA